MNRQVFFIVLLLLIIPSCMQEGRTHFTSDDRLWFDGMTQGDRWVMVDDNSDTCFVGIVKKGVYDSYFQIDPIDHKAFARVEFDMDFQGRISQGQKLSGVISVQRDSVLHITLKVGNLVVPYLDVTNNGPSSDSIDCIYIDEDRKDCFSYPFHKSLHIKDFIWNRSMGLLQFSTLDGETFHRIISEGHL